MPKKPKLDKINDNEYRLVCPCGEWIHQIKYDPETDKAVDDPVYIGDEPETPKPVNNQNAGDSDAPKPKETKRTGLFNRNRD